MKRCSGCKKNKRLSSFGKDKNEKDGKNHYCKKCVREQRRLWVLNNPEKRKATEKASKLLKAYKITMDDYNKILKKQGGVCAICYRKETVRNHERIAYLAVDHDHKTKRIRGLLCNQCNRSLGGFCDNIHILNNAIKYLRKSVK